MKLGPDRRKKSLIISKSMESNTQKQIKLLRNSSSCSCRTMGSLGRKPTDKYIS